MRISSETLGGRGRGMRTWSCSLPEKTDDGETSSMGDNRPQMCFDGDVLIFAFLDIIIVVWYETRLWWRGRRRMGREGGGCGSSEEGEGIVRDREG